MLSTIENTIRNRGSNHGLFVAIVVFCITVLALTIFGLIMIFSSSYVEAISNGNNALSYVVKQFVFIVLGIACAILIVRFFSTSLLQGKVLLIAFILLMLCFVLVLGIGDSIYGAKRWFYVGPVSMQPSEFMKIVVVVYTSALICNFRYENEEPVKFFIKIGIFVLLPIAWILILQKYMGTASIIVVGFLVCLWLSGVDKRIIIGIIVACLLIGLVVIFSSPHRWSRVLALLFPEQYAEEGGYQLIRSRYAMAGGGLFGLGIGNSHEKFQYLPEAETDFIFAILVEETGIIGALLVLLGFFVLLASGLYIAACANDRFSKSIAASLVIMLVFQALLNIACVVGLFPVTGKPLPFFTQGGSSVISTYCLCGIVVMVGMEALKNDSYSKLRRQTKITSNRRRNAT